jgi:alpha-1,6-mannosyltransferase
VKICDATQFYSDSGVGGVRRYLTEKRRYIASNGKDEHVLVVPGAKTEKVRDGRLTLCTVASPPLGASSRYRLLLNMRAAEEFIREAKPDVIECGDPYHLGWHLLKVAGDMDVPLLGFYHSHFPEAYLRTAMKYCGKWVRDVVLEYARDYIRRLYNSFDETLVPSAYLRNLLESWGVRNTRRVKLGVDTHVFRPGEPDPAVRLRYLGLEGQKLLLYVGRLAGEKNTRVLLKAFRCLSQMHPKRFGMLIIGQGPLGAAIQQAQLEGLSDLHWISEIKESDWLADYYRSADLFVHPGVCETFGLVALESQACATPVVGIRGSYMDANIFAGLEHWATTNTPEALADAVARFCNLDTRAIGLQASQVVREGFSWQRAFEEIWTVYREAVERKKRRARDGAMFYSF